MNDKKNVNQDKSTKLTKFAGYYSLILGLSMIILWLMLIFNNQVVEYNSKPIEIIIHIINEYLTGFMLIISGYGLIKSLKWGKNIFFIAIGMNIYALIDAWGYYVQLGEIVFIIMFIVFLIINLFLIPKMMKN